MTAPEPHTIGEAPSHAISDVRAWPLTQRLPAPTQTSWGRYDAVSILVVELRTHTGLSGFGEALARFAPRGYAELIDMALAPRLIGQDATAIEARWRDMRRALSGRAGGVLIEAIAAVDIALWDILGQAAGLPLWQLLGGVGRDAVPVYGASVRWGDDAAAEADVEAMLARGFREIKVKIGRPVGRARERVARVRALAGDDVALSADANWAYGLDEAVLVGEALARHNYVWLEEPLRPEDERGYAELARRCAVPLAAGESNFTLDQALPSLRSRTLSVLQPNVTRAGGITETRRMAELADMHGVAYAPHVGMSGIICEVASLHLAAAMPNARTMECPFAANRFRSDLADIAPGSERARDGLLGVPEGPGLGLTIDRDALERLAA